MKAYSTCKETILNMCFTVHSTDLAYQ